MGRTIDPTVEKHSREMLGLAIRGELQELATQIQAVGGEIYREILGLCLVAAAYMAVEASGRWPTEADLREIARGMIREETRLNLDEDEIYNYVSRAALNYEPLAEAMGSDEAAAAMPLLITSSMLFNLRPHEMEWWEYLDQVWNANLTAENLDESVLPAVQVRIHREKRIDARRQP